MRAYCVTYYTVWPITAKVKVWPLLRHVLEYACVCDVRQRGAPRAGVVGRRRSQAGGVCAHRSHTFIVRARIGQLIRLRRGVSVRFNINKLF